MKKPNIDPKLEMLSVLDHLGKAVKPADIKDQLKEDGIYDARKPHDWNNTLESLVSQEMVQKTLTEGSKRYTYQITEHGTKQLGLWRPKSINKPAKTETNQPEAKEPDTPPPPAAGKETSQAQTEDDYGTVFEVISEQFGRETFEKESQAMNRAHFISKEFNTETSIYETKVKPYGTVKPITSTQFEAA